MTGSGIQDPTATVSVSGGSSSSETGSGNNMKLASLPSESITTVTQAASQSEIATSKAIQVSTWFIGFITAIIVVCFASVIVRDGNTTEVTSAISSLTIMGTTGFATLVLMTVGKNAGGLVSKLIG